MDTGVYGYEFRLLSVLDGDEGGAGDFPGSAQLLGRGFRFREGVGLVFRPRSALSPSLCCSLHRRALRIAWLWSSVAYPPWCPLSALFPGQSSPSFTQNSSQSVVYKTVSYKIIVSRYKYRYDVDGLIDMIIPEINFNKCTIIRFE